MGQIFELISDEALSKERHKINENGYCTECDVCGAESDEADLYPYQGKQYDEDGKPMSWEDDPYTVCVNCILAGKVTHECDFEYIKTIDTYLDALTLTTDEKEALKIQLIEKYQRTPNIPIFMQRTDLPLCCNDITEFVGYPENEEDLYRKTEGANYWQEREIGTSHRYDFRKQGNPESWRDVAAFRCQHCGKEYFTFQFT